MSGAKASMVCPTTKTPVAEKDSPYWGSFSQGIDLAICPGRGGLLFSTPTYLIKTITVVKKQHFEKNKISFLGKAIVFII